MRFFNLDLHVSVIADVRKIFNDLGHEVDDWTLSGHSWLFGRTRDSVDIVNEHTWRSLDQAMCDAFYNRYKEELSRYDGFICTYAPSFCLLYEKFKKPIITIAPIRYEAPFSDSAQKWAWLNDYLRDGIDSGLIIPIANNKFDKQYCEVHTGREWEHIPSLCEYTDASYTPEFDSYLYQSRFPLEMVHYDPLIKNKQQLLPSGYSWHELAKVRGIIHIPYCPSTMSIFENYTSSIPMFFPSYAFMLKLRESFGSLGVLSEMSWRQVYGLPPGSIVAFDDDGGKIGDVNKYDNIESEQGWIALSDFYDEEWMPHIQYFDSFPELSYKLNSVDTTNISQLMSSSNQVRKQKIYNSWKSILGNI